MATSNIKAQVRTTSAAINPTIAYNSELLLVMEVELFSNVTINLSLADFSIEVVEYSTLDNWVLVVDKDVADGVGNDSLGAAIELLYYGQLRLRQMAC